MNARIQAKLRPHHKGQAVFFNWRNRIHSHFRSSIGCFFPVKSPKDEIYGKGIGMKINLCFKNIQ
jgi:hypothetical protein